MSHAAIRRMALSAFATSIFLLLTVVLLVFTLPFAGGGRRAQQETISRLGEQISLPARISCTSLTVQSLATYDGPFYEDGSGKEVIDVAAVLLRNEGDTCIPYASIVVDTKTCRYSFRAYMIPANSTVLVPEISARKFTDSRVVNIFGWHTVEKTPSEPELQIWELGETQLGVRNTSNREMREITVYFRKYIQGVGVGGKPQKFAVDYLPPGETVTVNPRYYLRGYSQILGYEKEGVLVATHPL